MYNLSFTLKLPTNKLQYYVIFNKGRANPGVNALSVAQKKIYEHYCQIGNTSAISCQKFKEKFYSTHVFKPTCVGEFHPCVNDLFIHLTVSSVALLSRGSVWYTLRGTLYQPANLVDAVKVTLIAEGGVTLRDGTQRSNSAP